MSESANLIRRRIEAMRPKLQDTSRRNPLINNVLGARTASFIRIVDEKPQSMLDALCGPDEKRMRLVPRDTASTMRGRPEKTASSP